MKRVAIVVALAALCACTTPHHPGPGGVPVVVYVAKVEIPRSTDAATVVSRGMIELMTVARTAIQPGAISSLNEIQGKLAIVAIPKGAQILGNEFASSSSGPAPFPPRPSRSR